MKKHLDFISKSILAGIFIGLAGFVYLSCANKIVGSFLFAFGLSCVVLYKLNLFTGKSGCLKNKEMFSLIPMILLNGVGCLFAAYIAFFKIGSIDDSLFNIITTRQNSSLLSILFLSIGTGIIMESAVKHSARFDTTPNFIPLLLGVPVFIICGMPHCVADAFYYSLYFINSGFDNTIIIPWLITIVGNFIGCNIPRLFLNIF